jgi:5,10-methylenetetrahydromethanopterin reductase
MRLACGLAPSPRAPEHAATAEALGYERVWYYDSPALYGDVWVAIARTLDRTRRIGVGTAVLVPSLRHVVTTAAAIGTIEAQAPGRLVVAIGTGYTGRMALGQPPLAWREVEAYVRSLRGLLRGDAVEVDGRLCQLIHPDGFLAKRPIEVPLVLAANGPKGLALARRIADGAMCAGVIPEGAAAVRYLVFGTVMEPGETFASPRVVDAIGGAIAVVYHGVYEAAGAGVDSLPSGAAWRAEIERLPEASRHLRLHEGHCVAPNPIDRRHLAPELGATTFSGTREALRERAAALARQGVSELIYAPMGPDVPRELRAMREALG